MFPLRKPERSVIQTPHLLTNAIMRWGVSGSGCVTSSHKQLNSQKPEVIINPSHAQTAVFPLLHAMRIYQKSTESYLPVVLSAPKFLQVLDSPWVRQFQEFQADLWVPADPEDQQLLSLRGNRALPEQWQITMISGHVWQPAESSGVRSRQKTYSGSSSTSCSTLSRNSLKKRKQS